MNILNTLLVKELDNEWQATRKMIERVPDDQLGWQPHPKSMTLKQLASHVVDIPGWPKLMLETEGIDFASDHDFQPTPVSSTADLLSLLETSYQKGREALLAADDELLLNSTWTMRAGEYFIGTHTKYESVRLALAQLIHHRAQLGVFLRLLNIPIPGSYGPSADEMEMAF